jgi:hypothetical protein
MPKVYWKSNWHVSERERNNRKRAQDFKVPVDRVASSRLLLRAYFAPVGAKCL